MNILTFSLEIYRSLKIYIFKQLCKFLQFLKNSSKFEKLNSGNWKFCNFGGGEGGRNFFELVFESQIVVALDDFLNL